MPPKKNTDLPVGNSTDDTDETSPPSYEDLPADLQKHHDRILAKLKEELIKHFVRTRTGSFRTTGHPETLLDGVDLSAPSEQRTASLRQEIESIVHHALVRQQRVMLNSLQGLINDTIKAVSAGESVNKGPTFGTFSGEDRIYGTGPEFPKYTARHGMKVEYVIYHPEYDGEPPAVYDSLPVCLPEGFKYELRYRPYRAGERPEPISEPKQVQ